MSTKKIAYVGLLIAMQVVLSRFLSISLPFVKIGFAFLPIAIIGMMYGPVYASIAAAIADVIGATLFPAGPFFPGFTITALLTGLAYGLLLHKKYENPVYIVIAAVVVCIVLELGLNTYWLSILLQKGYIALLPTRIVKSIIMVFVQFICIFTVSKAFKRVLATA